MENTLLPKERQDQMTASKELFPTHSTAPNSSESSTSKLKPTTLEGLLPFDPFMLFCFHSDFWAKCYVDSLCQFCGIERLKRLSIMKVLRSFE